MPLLSTLRQAATRATGAGIRSNRTSMAQIRTFSASVNSYSEKKDPFPSLLVGSDKLVPVGEYAKSQAEFLSPDMVRATKLGELLKKKNVGVVAHFYMDAELQGSLGAIDYEHIFVADSLAMGEAAVKMAQKGVNNFAVLGVDFMSESVKATLKQQGFPDANVYRLKENTIGCSLAASAERPAYWAYLAKAAAEGKNPLHVVYINTSMETKARANSIVPTITCTSSNVVRTVLTAAAQIKDVSIYFGPDTYMGENLKNLFTQMLSMSDEQIKEYHPDHDRTSIESLLQRFQYFQQGICVVHHMFGGKVTETVEKDYPIDENTFYTAHFEVPGEMFTLASKAMHEGNGVVGSTSNILNFIVDKTLEHCAKGSPKARFVLGTESGMVTGIVRKLQEVMPADSKTQAEIIFPVSSEAISNLGGELGELAIIPGVKEGEGCSTAGGCASCPFMKMNDLDSLDDLVEQIPDDGSANASLDAFRPKTKDNRINGVPVVDAGAVPIQHMRHLMSTGKLSDRLVEEVTNGGK